MLVPNTRLFAAGEVLSGAILNQTVTSLGNFLLGKPIASLYQTTTVTSVGTTATVIGFDAETIDRDGGHSTSTQNSRYTAQTPGWYRVSGTVVFDTSTNLVWTVYLTKNGSANPVTGSYNRLRLGASAGGGLSVPMSTTLVYLNGSTDYVELTAVVGTIAVNTAISAGNTSNMSLEWVSL